LRLIDKYIRNMETKITKGIKISVECNYQDEQSNPAKQQFAFSYQVTIENQSQHTVQLMRRHWYIFDACGIRREVEGDGVIGEQPVLKPSERHSYRSWCPLQSGIGTMRGYFTMVRITDDAKFKVEVPQFNMMATVMMN